MIEAGALGTFAIFCLAVTRDGDQQRVGVASLAELGGDVVAVDYRQADVEQYGVGIDLFEEFERATAVVGEGYLMAVHFEEHRLGLSRVAIVVDDEDVERRMRGLQVDGG